MRANGGKEESMEWGYYGILTGDSMQANMSMMRNTVLESSNGRADKNSQATGKRESSTDWDPINNQEAK